MKPGMYVCLLVCDWQSLGYDTCCCVLFVQLLTFAFSTLSPCIRPMNGLAHDLLLNLLKQLVLCKCYCQKWLAYSAATAGSTVCDDSPEYRSEEQYYLQIHTGGTKPFVVQFLGSLLTMLYAEQNAPLLAPSRSLSQFYSPHIPKS